MSPHSIEIGSLIRAAEHLAPLSASAIRLSDLLGDERCDLEEITRTVRFDLALTGRFLGAANASSAGGTQPIISVEDASMQLGSAAVLEMVHRSLGPQEQSPDPVSGKEQALWKHSVLCAIATEGIEHYAKSQVMPEAFATALLHDVGGLLLARQPQSDGLPPFSHAQLGARVARQWGLPAMICAGIEHHHAPLNAGDGPARQLCAQVLLGDAVASEIDENCGLGEPVPFSPALAGSLGLTQKGFLGLCEETKCRYESVIHSYAA